MHNMLCTPSAVSQAGAPSSALPTGPHCDVTLKGWTGRRSTGAPLVLHLAFYFCGNSPEDAFGLGLVLRHINTAAQARWVLFHNIGHRHSVNFRQNSGSWPARGGEGRAEKTVTAVAVVAGNSPAPVTHRSHHSRRRGGVRLCTSSLGRTHPRQFLHPLQVR